MKAPVLYRIASVLLVLFALGQRMRRDPINPCDHCPLIFIGTVANLVHCKYLLFFLSTYE
jgi:energy-converting hydrogenase Eha subunit C